MTGTGSSNGSSPGSPRSTHAWRLPSLWAVRLSDCLQGPSADALTHVGQIALLRRLVGAPVKGENYFKAEVETGHVGKDQAPPLFEFD